MLLQGMLFLAIMALTLYAVFHGQNLEETGKALFAMKKSYVALSVAAAILFVSLEGTMIWYLLDALGQKNHLLRCVSYSFIGFFYSGITPSATGGQPMQLYYMKKDGNSISESTVVLMTVAVIYKFVLVVTGLVTFLFGGHMLKEYMKGYLGLFFLGMFLNVVLVVFLVLIMWKPVFMEKCYLGLEKLLLKLKIFKPSSTRIEKVHEFIEKYQSAVSFFGSHKAKIVAVVMLTFVQRGSMFVLTYFIYRGFGLTGVNPMVIIALQAAVYVAVDMLPVPGAQGITELVYSSIFLGIFTQKYLMPSMLITRGINFYFLLLVSASIVVINLFAGNRKNKC